MQQVVDLQSHKTFGGLDVELLAISPDPLDAWQEEGGSYGITVPMLSDPENAAWDRYGTSGWMMGSEPGHAFFLVGGDGRVAWVRDYAAPEHGGLMYVPPDDIASQVHEALAGS
jgi:peroxiredoxin Q/BCP